MGLKRELPERILRKLIIHAIETGGIKYWDSLKGTDWQVDHEIVTVAVENAMWSNLVPGECKRSHDFCMTRLRCEGDIDCMGPAVLKYKDIWFCYSKHRRRFMRGNNSSYKEKFDLLPPSCHTSHSFCQQLVQVARAKDFAFHVYPGIMRKTSILLQAVANSCHFDYGYYELRSWSGEFRQGVQQILGDFESFFKILLCASKRPESPFYKVSNGDSLRIIGSFLDIPLESCFLQAAVHMGMQVFHPYNTLDRFTLYE